MYPTPKPSNAAPCYLTQWDLECLESITGSLPQIYAIVAVLQWCLKIAVGQ